MEVRPGTTDWSGRFLLGRRWASWIYHVCGNTALLAVLTIGATVRAGTCWTARGLFLTAHLGLSFLGAALGLRFFKGYYLQVLPVLLWIAAHPNGFVMQWFQSHLWSSPWNRVRSTLLILASLLVISPALLHDVDQVRSIRKQRTKARDPMAQKIGAFIKRNTQDDDRIWVWGRWAWPVYFHSDRKAATHYPKSWVYLLRRSRIRGAGLQKIRPLTREVLGPNSLNNSVQRSRVSSSYRTMRTIEISALNTLLELNIEQFAG